MSNKLHGTEVCDRATDSRAKNIRPQARLIVSHATQNQANLRAERHVAIP